MAGYTRQDTANDIANGKVIDADVFDSEYNAIEDAFNATTGHSHDGSAGEGAPITVVGPAQDVIISATQVLPKTSNTLDLGSAAAQYKSGWFDGTLTTDTLVVDESATIATTLDVTGATTLGSTLDVTGDVTLGGALTVGGVSVAEYISDTVGAMVSSNTESGITVTYQDADNTLDFDVGDFTLTLAGDLTGSATITNLGSATLTAAVIDDSHNHTASTITDFTSAGTTVARNSISVGEGLDYNSTTGEISAEFATSTNKGVASFNSTDFAVTSGVVTLAKDPTITLTGDVSGSGTMTNLGSVTINVTVADDSHNHTIANIDNLSTQLAAINTRIDNADNTIGADITLDTTGAQVIDTLTTNNGVITALTTRNMTLSDLGYTGSGDIYGGWNLYLNGTSTDTIGSAERLGFDAGSGIDITYDGDDLTISHADTSSQASINAGPNVNNFVQDLTLDTYGHVTGGTSVAINFAAGNASLSEGAVGTYAMLARTTGGTTITAGSSYAGSGLAYVGFITYSGNILLSSSGTFGSTVSGTWRAMGTANNGTSDNAATIFMRIS